MQARSQKKILAWILGLMVLTSSTLAMAHPVVVYTGHRPNHYYNYRYNQYANRVDSKVEAKFDRNHNGWLSESERYRMASARVDSRQEWRCDYNHDGYIDATWERWCD